MVNSKKLLSLFLAVVMLVSTFSVMAFAYTVGPEVSGDINFKYTVEKTDMVPETAAGSAEWYADNIYAVSVWMQSDDAVTGFTVPFHYNKAHFSPIMLSDGECTYPQGAGLDQDTYYTDMGEGALYAYAEGDYLNNTGMYKANGTTATTKALAKCIGLGNSNSAGVTITAELVSPDHPLYSKWGAGLPENTGVMYAQLDVTGKAKTAYLNTISGITQDTGWNKMFTVYFETLDGVTDADVVGDEFGVYTADCFTVDGITDEYAGYFTAATTAIVGNPNKNVVENAVVEAAAEPSIVNPLKGQIRFHKDENGDYDGGFDIRALAVITGDDFAATFGDEAAAESMIKEAGFVFAAGSNVSAPAIADVKALVENGTAAAGYTKKTVSFISRSTDPGNYVFSCIVTDLSADADYENSLVAVGYIKYEKDGQTLYAYYPSAQTIAFAPLFDTYFPG